MDKHNQLHAALIRQRTEGVAPSAEVDCVEDLIRVLDGTNKIPPRAENEMWQTLLLEIQKGGPGAVFNFPNAGVDVDAFTVMLFYHYYRTKHSNAVMARIELLTVLIQAACSLHNDASGTPIRTDEVIMLVDFDAAFKKVEDNVALKNHLEHLILQSGFFLQGSPDQPRCTERAAALCKLVFDSKIDDRWNPLWQDWIRMFYAVSRAANETFGTATGRFFTAGDLYLMLLEAETPDVVPDLSKLPALPELSTKAVLARVGAIVAINVALQVALRIVRNAKG